MLKFFFGVDIYKHHWLAMVLNISICSFLKLITIILSIVEKDDNELYIKHWYIVPIGIIIYLILIGFRALYITGIKWFIELKFVSHTILLTFFIWFKEIIKDNYLIIYGIVGSILSIIFCIAATYIDCNKIYDENIAEDICFFNFKENQKIFYFDNLFIYFKDFNPYKIILIILGFITFFTFKYFYILTIKMYNQVFALFSTPLQYFFEKIILMINTLVNEHSLFIKKKENLYFKKIAFSLDIFGDIISVIGFLIYLEIIEINCYGLNFNIKNRIISRSIDNYRDPIYI